MSAVVGLIACAISSVFFGSMFVPIKKYHPGDGLFVQWILSCAILFCGIVVNAAKDFPQFQPLAMVGGALWAIGNLTSVPIINMIGLGMGILVWGTVNCLVGWACGRFGLFGIKPSLPSSPMVNYVGLAMVVAGGFLISQIRPTITNDDDDTDGYPEVDNDDEEYGERRRLLYDNESAAGSRVGSPVQTSRSFKIPLGIAMSVIAGMLYGVTFVPVIYIQDHKEDFRNASAEAISYAFSHYCGIFVASTVSFVIYLVYTQNKPYVNTEAILPAFFAGLLWSIAQLSWFVANDALSQAVTFPIISMVPGVIAALWSVFYFKEIQGKRNLRILSVTIAITLVGATLVGLSKG